MNRSSSQAVSGEVRTINENTLTMLEQLGIASIANIFGKKA